MKKIICLVLCLSVLSVIAITTAFADVPVIIQNPSAKISFSGTRNLKVTATLPGAPAKSGYYSSAWVRLTVTYKYGSGVNKGKNYTRSASDSANGEWGKKTRNLSCSVTAANMLNDYFVTLSSSAQYQYYGIKQY